MYSDQTIRAEVSHRQERLARHHHPAPAYDLRGGRRAIRRLFAR